MLDLTFYGTTLIACFAVPALMFGLVYYVYYQHKSRVRDWDEFAKGIGLTLEPGNLFVRPRVTGNYRRRAITLDTFSRGSRKHRKTYTRIVLLVNNPSNIYLALYVEDVFSKIGNFFGMADVQIGDDEIDQRFTIKSRPETFAARLFASSNLRQKLLQARSVNLKVDGRELYFEQRGMEADPDYLQFLFDLLSDVAEMVERSG